MTSTEPSKAVTTTFSGIGITGGTPIKSTCQISPPRATRDLDSNPVSSSPLLVNTPAISMLSTHTPVKLLLSVVQ